MALYTAWISTHPLYTRGYDKYFENFDASYGFESRRAIFLYFEMFLRKSFFCVQKYSKCPSDGEIFLSKKKKKIVLSEY
jgi:hypothetical protein